MIILFSWVKTLNLSVLEHLYKGASNHPCFSLPGPLQSKLSCSDWANDCTFIYINPLAASRIKKRTDVSERRVNLTEYCPLERESQTEQLYFSTFAGGSNPFLFIRQQGGMFSPDGFLVQVSPMRANICSAQVSLSNTLAPLPSLWMNVAAQLQWDQYCITIFITIHEGLLRLMLLLWPLPCQKMTEDKHLIPVAVHLVADQMQLFSSGTGAEGSHHIYITFFFQKHPNIFSPTTIWKHLANRDSMKDYTLLLCGVVWFDFVAITELSLLYFKTKSSTEMNLKHLWSNIWIDIVWLIYSVMVWMVEGRHAAVKFEQ